MPPRDLGNPLVANWAEALLLFPEVAEPPSPFESGFHLHVEAFFKIRFPGRIVRARFCADLRMPLNADRGCCQQSNHFHLPFLSFEIAGEHPAVGPSIGKVFVFHPAAWFMLMSSTCPFPDGLEDGMIDGMKNRKARPHDDDRVPIHEFAD